MGNEIGSIASFPVTPPAADSGAERTGTRRFSEDQTGTPEDKSKDSQADRRSERKPIDELAQSLLNSSARLTIEEDAATGAFVYKSIDRNTGEVLRQWPRDEILRLRRYFEGLDGLVIDRKV